MKLLINFCAVFSDLYDVFNLLSQSQNSIDLIICSPPASDCGYFRFKNQSGFIEILQLHTNVLHLIETIVT